MTIPVYNLDFSKKHPLPFVQPLLELTLAGDKAEDLAPGSSSFYIDVGGEIDMYITKANRPTDLLVDLCKAIARSGAVVTSYTRYEGSAGPNVIMRNGTLFYRMKSIEELDAKIFAYEYREPKYRGYPPISHGTRVKTTVENVKMRREWTREALACRKWDTEGEVIAHHDSHGLCYDIKHDDGSTGSYDPSEFEIIDA